MMLQTLMAAPGHKVPLCKLARLAPSPFFGVEQAQTLGRFL
jgi:hypothetical protein